jgi:hypothetical protein
MSEKQAYINVRFPLDQKAYLDGWAKELSDSLREVHPGSLARLLIAEAIVAHAKKAGVTPPQSLVDDPPRMKS